MIMERHTAVQYVGIVTGTALKVKVSTTALIVAQRWMVNEMTRLEAYRVLSKMWDDATPEQEEAINIAQDAIEFIDLMPNDMVAVVRCKDCKYGEKDTETADLWYLCKYDGCVLNYVNHYCGYGKRRASDE